MARADAEPFWEKETGWLIHLAEFGQETAEVLVGRFGMTIRQRNQRLGSFAEKLFELHRALRKLPETCPPRADARVFRALGALRRTLADLRPTELPELWELLLPRLNANQVQAYHHAAYELGKLVKPPVVNAFAREAERAQAAAAARGKAKRSLSLEEANQKAMALAKADRSFVHKTQRQWAKAIGCSVGLVARLPLWQQTMKRFGRGKGEKKARVVHMKPEGWDKVAAADSEEDLRQLIEEQEADDRQQTIYPR